MHRESPDTSDGPLPFDGAHGPAEGTRERILAAAREIIVEEGYGRLSLERVAERAGVVRATIYYQFGSKSGLLEGLLQSMALRGRVDLSRQQDHSLGQLLERVTWIWEHEGDVGRSLVGMAAVDPPTGEVVNRHQRGRRERIAELVERLHDAGHLRVAPEDAIDLLWLLTSFEAYDFLRQLTSRDPDDVRRLLELLAATVVDPDARHP